MKSLIAFIFILFALDSYACDCRWIGDFYESIQKSNPDLIVKAEIKSKIIDDKGFETSMKVEISNSLKGRNVSKVITIWGDQGADCRPYTSQFEIGEVYYFALNTFFDDYEIFNCGEHYVKVEGGKVRSVIRIREGLKLIGELNEIDFLERLRQAAEEGNQEFPD